MRHVWSDGAPTSLSKPCRKAADRRSRVRRAGVLAYLANYLILTQVLSECPMSDAFKALADPTRRRILRILRDGPLTSGEIAERFDTSWPTVSRHLAMLRDAG